MVAEASDPVDEGTDGGADRIGWDGVRYRVLGPVAVCGENGPVRLGGPKQRAVLAVLLLNANRVVPEERLYAQVWGEEHPASVRGQVQVHVSGLRKLVGRSTIVRQPPGYLFEVRPGELDLHVFDDAVAQAGVDLAEGRAEAAANRLGDALLLWRGPALGGVSEPLVAYEGARLEERRLNALEALFQAQLAAGRHAETMGELRRAADEHPLRESIQALLMLALHRCGRTPEALQVYSATRRHLVDELGIEPGEQLRRTQRRILGGDDLGGGDVPSLAATPPSAAVSTPVPPVPRQLPADVTPFVGRVADLRRLDGMLPSEGGPASGTATIVATVSGTAGVGKTALAVHWAHRVADRFPDGQLYVNLQGFDPAGQVVTPAEAVHGFLEALGVPAHTVPASLDGQVRLYRSLLAGKRMLVLLDNALNAEQVRPLLPAASTCAVVVTSRDQLSGIVTTAGAHPVTVEVLTATEARELLAGRLGTGRVAAEPRAVDEIIAACARLPLALAVVAARAAIHADFPLSTLAVDVRADRRELDAFAEIDPHNDVREVFSWSYRALTAAAARLFRLLGLHPGPAVSLPAAASLAGVPIAQVRPLLAELSRTSLIREHPPGRYGMHDLLRAYAAELAGSRDTADERRAAEHRMLDHYLHTAFAAARLISPNRPPITPLPPRVGVTTGVVPDDRRALAWLEVEQPVLLAAIRQSVDRGFYTHTWHVAWTVQIYLGRKGNLEAVAAAMRAALDATRRLGDRSGQAYAHLELGVAYNAIGRPDDAGVHMRHALAMYEAAGDLRRQGQAHLCLARLCDRQGRYTDSLAHNEQALELYRRAGHTNGEASVMNSLGWCHVRLGNYRQALDWCGQGLVLFEKLDNRIGRASTWDSLGYAHLQLGDYHEAAGCYQHAVGLFRDAGDRVNEADSLAHVGDAWCEAGNTDAARQAWRQALLLLAELGRSTTAGAADLRAKLHGIDHRTP